jgi:hypothetical protein
VLIIFVVVDAGVILGNLLCELSELHRLISIKWGLLGGVVVSMLATGPKGCGFEPGQGDGLLRVINIRNTPSSRMGSKAGDPLS